MSNPSASDPPPVFDLARLETSGPIASLEFHLSIESTNTRAFELARDPQRAMPTLVLAERQTAGRGRGSNRWWSEGGALTFSLIVEPQRYGLCSDQWPRVSLAASLATAETLDTLLDEDRCQLKWPNDVFLGGRKIAGILVEVPGVSPPRMVVGIGINVNNSLADAPRDVQARATSIVDATGKRSELTEVLLDLLQRVDAALVQLGQDEAALLARWRQRCLLHGRRIAVESGGRHIEGICGGIDHEGALRIDTPTGPERVFGGIVSHFGPAAPPFPPAASSRRLKS